MKYFFEGAWEIVRGSLIVIGAISALIGVFYGLIQLLNFLVIYVGPFWSVMILLGVMLMIAAIVGGVVRVRSCKAAIKKLEEAETKYNSAKVEYTRICNEHGTNSALAQCSRFSLHQAEEQLNIAKIWFYHEVKRMPLRIAEEKVNGV